MSTVRTAPFKGYHVLRPEPKVLQRRVSSIKQNNRFSNTPSLVFKSSSTTSATTKPSSPRASGSTEKPPQQSERKSVFLRLRATDKSQDQSFCDSAPKGSRQGGSFKKRRGGSSSSLADRRWRCQGGGVPGRLCRPVEKPAGRVPGYQDGGTGGGFVITNSTSTHPLPHRFRDQKQSARPSTGCRRIDGQRSCRTSWEQVISRILQPAVSGPQEDRRFASDDRPFRAQQTHDHTSLLHGNTGVSLDGHPVARVDSLHRHMRRLSAGSDAQSWQKVPAFCGEQEDASVHLPYIRLATSQEFTKLLRPVVAWLRKQGVKLHVYLDDWLIRAESSTQAAAHAELTMQVLQRLGWIINFDKSDLVPSQDFEFIGMHFSTRQFTVAPLPKMRLKVQSVYQLWMAYNSIPARDLHRLLGCLWQHWFRAGDFVFGQSIGGQPQSGARRPGTGATESWFLSGFCPR